MKIFGVRNDEVRKKIVEEVTKKLREHWLEAAVHGVFLLCLPKTT